MEGDISFGRVLYFMMRLIGFNFQMISRGRSAAGEREKRFSYFFHNMCVIVYK